MSIHFASVGHPESNGLVERENGIILLGITIFGWIAEGKVDKRALESCMES
jgi:hypothetical protein